MGAITLNVQIKAVVEVSASADNLKDALEETITWGIAIAAMKKGILDGSIKIVGVTDEWDVE